MSAEEYYERAYQKWNESNDYYGAIEEFTKAIEVDPNYIEAYYDRAFLRGMIKDYYGQIEDYTEIIKINPDFDDYYWVTRAYSGRGKVRLYIDGLEAACEDWKKAADLGDKFDAEWFEEYCN